MSLGVVHDACRDLVGIAGLQGFRRLPVDEEIQLAFEHVAGLDSRMGMTAGRAARRDFRDGCDGVVALRKLDFLEWGALDAGLLGKGGNGKSFEVKGAQAFFEYAFSSLDPPTLAASRFPARAARQFCA